MPRHPLVLILCVLLPSGVALVGFRLIHAIAWPWWVVSLPLLLANALAILSVVFLLAGSFLVEWRSARRRHRNQKNNQYRLLP